VSGYLSTEPADLRTALEEIRELALQNEPDSARIRRSMLVLRALFEDLTVNAQNIVDRIDQGHELPPSETRRLIEYGKHLIGALQLESDRIAGVILEIEAAGFEHRLQDIESQWQSQWHLFRQWFVAQPDSPSTSQILRDSASASIAKLLRHIRNHRDHRIGGIDRTADFLILAQWFAESASDDDAHRIWHAAFGLNTARHWTIDDASLDDRESQHIPVDISWKDAPPLKTSIDPRRYSTPSAGGLSRIIDRSAEKEKLAASSREEAERLLQAQQRFCNNGRIRLSDLQNLDGSEFERLLDLLAEAMSARVDSAEPVEVIFADGGLRIRLEPSGENREAFIRTSEGILRGPDHWMSIEQIPTSEVPEVLR